jgi:type II secretory pathway component GspD/PulD (secretin)
MKQMAIKPLILASLLAACAAVAAPQPGTASPPTAVSSTVPPAGASPATSFVFRDTPIAELFEMISRHERVNIMLGKGVTGNVAVSLYDMTPRQAIYAIAEAGGYQVVVRDNGYMIVNPADTASAAAVPAGQMEVRALKVLYSEPQLVADILSKHVGRGGKATVLPSRRMVVVEDTPEGMKRIVALLHEIDTQPQQIMIEAKILEISLDENENFGIEWSKIFSGVGLNASRIGTTGLVTRGAPGLALNLVNSNVDLFLNALNNKGRVRTLATPKLLTLENQEASTNIGDKLGYRVTTTINNVTSETIQFLETGVILRVTPSVDSDGRIALRIRPEVSSGSLLGGIPSKKTTEVNTQLVAEDGQSILIGGLIKSTTGQRRIGVPLLGDVPGLGKLFSNNEHTGGSTETIVVITPRIVPTRPAGADLQVIERVERMEGDLQKKLAVPEAALNIP